MQTTVTTEQLAAVIEAMQGAQPATMKTRTIVDLLKTGNPYAEVVKFSHVNCMIGANYENAVNRQQKREGGAGDFEAALPKWGNRIGKKLITHKGKLYVPVHVQRIVTEPTYQDAATGLALDKSDFAEWMPSKSTSSRQEVEKEVIYRPYTLSNILELTIGGNTYVVNNNPVVVLQFTHRPNDRMNTITVDQTLATVA